VLEAEDGDITQGTIIDCNDDCSGAGIVQLDSDGSSIQWQANTITTGSHLLLLRYINGIQADATLDISINGRQAGTLTLPFTGNWNISLTLSTCVTLREGNNTIQIQTTSDTGPIIDCVNAVCAETNLAAGKEIECSQEQPKHSAKNVTDLNLNTSWMAEGFPQCFEIDLGHVYDIDKTQIICDDSHAYQYRIETRTCACKQYETAVDQTDSRIPFSISSPRIDTFEPIQARYIRLTITGVAGEQTDEIAIREFGVFPNFQNVTCTPVSN
jgi:poly(beta-D-mannuronate) lyase